MKLYRFLLSIFFLLAVSCGNSDDSIPETRDYRFFENSEIVINNTDGFEFTRIENGNKLVFQYRFVGEQDEDIADDEYSETILFEIDTNLDEFSFQDDELINQKLLVQRFCFCASIPVIRVSNGTIAGKKLSNDRWAVDISISFKWDENDTNTVTKNIDGLFEVN